MLSDKTGTITNGMMSVSGIVDYDGKVYENELELSKNPDFFDLVGHLIILNNEVVISEGRVISGIALIILHKTKIALSKSCSRNSSSGIKNGISEAIFSEKEDFFITSISLSKVS